MKRSVWFIDGWEDRFSTLSEAKERLNFAWTKKELENDFSNGGFIYHYVNDESVGGIPFEFKNGKLQFHKSVKESF
jgi:hypothetical protein